MKHNNGSFFHAKVEDMVNREIIDIAIDPREIVKKVGEEIFNHIYSEQKYRYNSYYCFEFNKIIDDENLSNSKNEIGIRIITPYFDAGKEFTELDLKMLSAREKSLIIKLPPHTSVVLEEIEIISRLQAYLARPGGSSSTPEIEDINNRKAWEVIKRQERVRSLLVEALKEADFYANSQKLELNFKNPVERINNGLKVLINGIYSKLNYINVFIENSSELQDILLQQVTQLKLVNDEDDANKLALEEVMGYIEKCNQKKIPVTMKTLLDLYSRAPYGWRPDDIRGLVFKLFKSQEIKMQLGGEYLTPTDKDLLQYMIHKDYIDRLLIKKRTPTPERLLDNARQLIRDLFNYTVLPDDEDSLMQEFKALAKNELSQVNSLLENYKTVKYPGQKVLEEGKALFKGILQIRDTLQFYEKLDEIKDNLLAYNQNIIVVKNFFKYQKGYFDRALRDLDIFNKNKTYILDGEVLQSVKEIEAVIYNDKPYEHLSRLPSLLDTFRKRFVQLLEKEIQPVRGVVEIDRKKVMEELESYPFKKKLFSKFKESFKDLLDRLDSCNNFYEAFAIKEESDRLKLRCFEEIEKMKQEHREEESEIEKKTGGDPAKPKYYVKKVVNVSIANIFHGARAIETEEDIEQLLEYIRTQLKKELKENVILKLI